MTAAERKDSTGAQPEKALIGGRYRLKERIGQGRLGEIFDAVDVNRQAFGDGQHVAIQIVSGVVGRSNSLYNKLKIGYQSLKAAGHPSIVRYRAFGRDGGTVYLVMERLSGAPLSLLLDDAGTLPLDDVLPVLRGVGDALQFLHAEDLVHGNLTASNVFITDKLDVRLLDVVPLGSANAVFPGKASGKPTSRSRVPSDVFALACLAYQMLAGKHPFNRSSPTPTLLTGQEPDRIAGLSDHEWNVLHRALTIDAEQPTYPVADFLRDFGVTGTERLWPAASSPPVTTPVRAPVPVVQPPYPVGWPDPEPEPDAPETRSLRAVLLAMLLASLAAWSYFGQPEEPVADLIAYVDSSMSGESAGGVTEVDPPASLPIAPEPLAELIVVAAERQPAAEPETVEALQVGPPEEPTAEPLAVQETVVQEAVAAEPVNEEPAAVPEVGFDESVVAVSERSGLARIWLRRDADSKLPLVWWTSENTAHADSDYIPVPERVVNTVPGGTLNIPLVNDNLPEQRESFYVDVGVRKSEGQIERLASIRVDIVDDDLR